MPLLRRKKPQPTTKSPHIPFDLVAEILCRLSVKQLIQLRCVCKSWNSLISGDSNFAEKQLRLSTSHDDRHHFIKCSREFVLYHTSISSIFSLAHPTMIRYSLRETLNGRKYDNGDIASTCDGIICYKIHNSSALLCNPSIRKFNILPPLRFQDQTFVEILYTVVYDRFTNNYKIIALNSSSSRKEVDVHTLGTDYWRRIHDFPGPDLNILSRSGIFLNDSVNWLTFDSASRSQFIVSLDLEKEFYQKLSLPVFGYFTTIPRTLGTWRGCLSLLYHRVEFSDVWIMKEYGNGKSWTKLLTVPHMRGCLHYYYTKAFYISKDDQVLMEYNMNGYINLVVYDFIKNIFKIPKFQNYIYTSEVYVESLISPL